MRFKDWKILTFFSVLFICSVFFYCLYETFISIAGSQDSIMAQQYMQHNTNLGSSGYSTNSYRMATMNVGQPSATFMSQYPAQGGIQPYAAYSQTGYAIPGSASQLISTSHRPFPWPDEMEYGPYGGGVDIDIVVVVPSHPTIADFARNLYGTTSLQSQYPFSGIREQYSLLMSSGWSPSIIPYKYEQQLPLMKTSLTWRDTLYDPGNLIGRFGLDAYGAYGMLMATIPSNKW